ncbi:MAG: hypothetical protein EOM25_01700 [Deltaproteobacteria bacterium]|nr:hypothetical protein [Deltaproteobacteria bacterium]
MRLWERFGVWWHEAVRIHWRITPRALQSLTGEILDLVRVARGLCSADPDMMAKLRRIHDEMDELRRLLDAKGALRLPVKQRRELLAGLEHSRDNLIQLIQVTPPPTDILQ